MANAAAKKLNLMLHLNPATSPADRVAVDALKAWYEECKHSHGDGSSADIDAEIRVFHHDVYLAGLHLYRINPRLCRHVAEALGQGELNMASLVAQLQACGLWTASAQEGVQRGEGVFSPAQLQQLQELLTQASAESSVTAPAPSPDPGLSRQLDEQKLQLDALVVELQQLRALAEQQALQLQRLNGSGPVAAVKPSSRGPAAEEMNLADMAPQIAQMQKIRQKGIF